MPTFGDLLRNTETGYGDPYRTLFGHSQLDGKQFAGVDITTMTPNELLAFASRDGEYGKWTTGQLGYLATPMGAGQIVGDTMRHVIEAGHLDPNQPFDRAAQDKAITYLANNRNWRSEWEGFKNVGPEDMADAKARWALGETGLEGGDMPAYTSELRNFGSSRMEEADQIGQLLMGEGGSDSVQGGEAQDTMGSQVSGGGQGQPPAPPGAGGGGASGLASPPPQLEAPGAPPVEPFMQELLYDPSIAAGAPSVGGPEANMGAADMMNATDIRPGPAMEFGNEVGSSPTMGEELPYEMGTEVEAPPEITPPEFEHMGTKAIEQPEVAAMAGVQQDELDAATPVQGDSEETADQKRYRRMKIGRSIYAIGAGLSQLGRGDPVNMARAAEDYTRANMPEALELQFDKATGTLKPKAPSFEQLRLMRKDEREAAGELNEEQQEQLDATAYNTVMSLHNQGVTDNSIFEKVLAGASQKVQKDAWTEILGEEDAAAKVTDQERRVDAIMADNEGMTRAEAYKLDANRTDPAESELVTLAQIERKTAQLKDRTAARSMIEEEYMIPGDQAAQESERVLASLDVLNQRLLEGGTETSAVSGFVNAAGGILENFGVDKLAEDLYDWVKLDRADFDLMNESQQRLAYAIARANKGQGSITENERKAMLQQMPNLLQSAEGRQLLIDRLRLYNKIDNLGREQWSNAMYDPDSDVHPTKHMRDVNNDFRSLAAPIAASMTKASMFHRDLNKATRTLDAGEALTPRQANAFVLMDAYQSYQDGGDYDEDDLTAYYKTMLPHMRAEEAERMRTLGILPDDSYWDIDNGFVEF